TEISTLSLHDALPILLTNSLGTSVTTWGPGGAYTVEYDGTAGPVTNATIDDYVSAGTLSVTADATNKFVINLKRFAGRLITNLRSEEHTSELQSPCNL